MNQKHLCKYLVFVALLFGTSAQARLGESLEQSIERYGRPIDKMADGGPVFLKDGIVITTHFTTNVCDLIIYVKKDGTPLSSDAIIKLVQDAESKEGARHWEIYGVFDKVPKFDKSPKQHKTYWLSDDGFVAYLNDDALVLRKSKDTDAKPEMPF